MSGNRRGNATAAKGNYESSPTGQTDPRPALAGLLVRKECWRLSWCGKCVVGLGITGLLLWVFFSVYEFLAVTNRAEADVLVVEGWVHKYAIQMAVTEFKNHPYNYVLSTGGPVVGNGGYTNDWQTTASVGAEALKEQGIPPESLRMIPSHIIGRDRTYSAALALRRWFEQHNVRPVRINVVTEDVHARRTRLLFQEGLGGSAEVGVIAVSNPDYDSKYWWQYSEGVKDVISESAAYAYAKFFFWPSAAKPGAAVSGRRSELE